MNPEAPVMMRRGNSTARWYCTNSVGPRILVSVEMAGIEQESSEDSPRITIRCAESEIRNPNSEICEAPIPSIPDSGRSA